LVIIRVLGGFALFCPPGGLPYFRIYDPRLRPEDLQNGEMHHFNDRRYRQHGAISGAGQDQDCLQTVLGGGLITTVRATYTHLRDIAYPAYLINLNFLHFWGTLGPPPGWVLRIWTSETGGREGILASFNLTFLHFWGTLGPRCL